MNTPIERLEMAAKSFADSNFVKKNHDKILEAIENDGASLHKRTEVFHSTNPVWAFVKVLENIMEDNQVLMPYMKWVLIMYIKKELRYEDITTVYAKLIEYDKLKRRKILEPNHRDINRFKSPSDLYKVIEEYDPVISELDDQEIKWLVDEGHAEIYKETPQVTVMIPLTFKGSQLMAMGNGWCTARNEFDFDDYTEDGTLYIAIEDKKPEYQFYIHNENESFFYEATNRWNKALDFGELRRLRTKYGTIFDVVEFDHGDDKTIYNVLLFILEHNDERMEYFYEFFETLPGGFQVKLLGRMEDENLFEDMMNQINDDVLKDMAIYHQEHDVRGFSIDKLDSDDIMEIMDSADGILDRTNYINGESELRLVDDNQIIWTLNHVSPEVKEFWNERWNES